VRIPAYLDTLLHQWGGAFDAGIGYNGVAAGFNEYSSGFPETSHSDEQEVERLGRLICELGHTGSIKAIHAKYRRRLNKKQSAFYCGCSKNQYMEFLEFAIGKLDRRLNE